MRWISVQIHDVQPASDSWALAGVFLGQDAGPLALVRFASKYGRPRAFARLDTNKHMFVDPMPQGIELSRGEIDALIRELWDRVRSQQYESVDAESLYAAQNA